MNTIPTRLKLLGVGLSPTEAEDLAGGCATVSVPVTPLTDNSRLSERLREPDTCWPSWMDTACVVRATDDLCSENMGPEERPFFSRWERNRDYPVPEGFNLRQHPDNKEMWLVIDPSIDILGSYATKKEAAMAAWDEALFTDAIEEDDAPQLSAVFAIDLPVPDGYRIDFQGSNCWTCTHTSSVTTTDFSSKTEARYHAWRKAINQDIESAKKAMSASLSLMYEGECIEVHSVDAERAQRLKDRIRELLHADDARNTFPQARTEA